MAVSGIITFGFLVVVGCVNGQNIIYRTPLVIRTLGKTALIKCEVDPSTLQSNVLHWYKASKGGAFKRLMYYEAKTTAAKNDPGVNRRYSGSLDRGAVTLTISTLTEHDEGTFYCALWSGNGWIKRFGSGTRLIVTEPGKDSAVAPKLSGYLNKATEKPVALCEARDMFPDLVSFKWEKKSRNGDWSEVSKEQIVEQSHNEDPVTSMVILNTPEDNIYRCTVTHEAAPKNPLQIEIKEDKKPPVNKPSVIPDPTCPPTTDQTPIPQESDKSKKKQSLQLFVYGYAVMLMKNVLHFIVVFIVLLKRKAGKKEERS